MTKTDLRNRIDALSPKGKKLFLLKLEQSLRSRVAQDPYSGHRRLVAYVKGKEGFDQSDLKSYLGENLPDFMIPSAILAVDEFPKLPNGKVDGRELSKLLDKTVDRPSLEARVLSDTEIKLKMVWEEILNFSPIDIRDNFFEIGGDSILSIQIIAKSRKVGINIAPNQLFEHQTISELALFVSEEQNELSSNDIIVGEVLLTPIQHWYFETHKNAPDHWNQAVKISGSLVDDSEKFEGSISHLVEKYESLRLAFKLENERWKAEALGPGKTNPFEYFDFSKPSMKSIEQRIESALIDTQNSFKLNQGNLFKCLYFDFGSEQENHVVLLAHHLVVDAVSWNILMEELNESLKISEKEAKAMVMSARTSLKDWAEHLLEMSELNIHNEEHEYWKKQTEGLKPLPRDMDENLPILEKDIERMDFTIEVNETAKLLSANENFNTKTEELLIAALQIALLEWVDGEEVVMGMERHGREVEDMSKDPSGTVGWLTSYFPIKLKSNGKHADIGLHVKSTKETLRNVPHGGLGYGILKYFKGSISNEPTPEIVFNFLGNQNAQASNSTFKVEPIQKELRHNLSERYYLLEINSFIKEGKLTFSWSYSRKIYHASTIENIISKFKNAISEITGYNAELGSNYSPSDFPEVELNQDDLDNLLDSLE